MEIIKAAIIICSINTVCSIGLTQFQHPSIIQLPPGEPLTPDDFRNARSFPKILVNYDIDNMEIEEGIIPDEPPLTRLDVLQLITHTKETGTNVTKATVEQIVMKPDSINETTTTRPLDERNTSIEPIIGTKLVNVSNTKNFTHTTNATNAGHSLDTITTTSSSGTVSVNGLLVTTKPPSKAITGTTESKIKITGTTEPTIETTGTTEPTIKTTGTTEPTIKTTGTSDPIREIVIGATESTIEITTGAADSLSKITGTPEVRLETTVSTTYSLTETTSGTTESLNETTSWHSESSRETITGTTESPIETAGFTESLRETTTVITETESPTIVDKSKRWPQGIIPYVLDSRYNEIERAEIAKAILTLRNLTCIQFVPRIFQEDYIFISKNLESKTCSSTIGRHGGRQLIYLSPRCLQEGHILHEMMHSIGFEHEQTRYDRDDYVTIIFANVMPDSAFNFKKVNHHYGNNEGPYDLGSITHYSKSAFGRKPGLITIIPKDQTKSSIMGQREGLSQDDQNKVKKYYKCPIGLGLPLLQLRVLTTTTNVRNWTDCIDFDQNCNSLAKDGYCYHKSPWMSVNCKKSCNNCGNFCQDFNKKCSTWALEGECVHTQDYMSYYCPKSCQLC